MSEDDIRVVDCECCDGTGWLELTPMPWPWNKVQRHVPCNWCGGSGKTTVFLKPVTLEDLEDGKRS